MRFLRSAFHSFVDHCPNFETWQATHFGHVRRAFPSVRSSSEPRLFGNSRRPHDDVAASWTVRPSKPDPSGFERSPASQRSLSRGSSRAPETMVRISKSRPPGGPAAGRPQTPGPDPREGRPRVRAGARDPAGMFRVSEDAGLAGRPARPRSPDSRLIGRPRRPAGLPKPSPGLAGPPGPGLGPTVPVRAAPAERESIRPFGFRRDLLPGGIGPGMPGPRRSSWSRRSGRTSGSRHETAARRRSERCRNSATPSTSASPTKE